jgi:hypothetical protein
MLSKCMNSNSLTVVSSFYLSSLPLWSALTSSRFKLYFRSMKSCSIIYLPAFFVQFSNTICNLILLDICVFSLRIEIPFPFQKQMNTF